MSTNRLRQLGRARPRVEASGDGGLARQLQRGLRPFQALNVGGQDVRPFLDKTDGSALVDEAGLAPGVVVTQALATTAIRPGAPWTNAAEIEINGLNAVGGNINTAAATEVITATFDVPADGEVIIELLATFEATNAETCEMALFVDSPGQKSMSQIRAQASNLFRLLEVNDPGGDASAVAQIIHGVTLTAGLHTATVWALNQLNPGEFIVPAGSASLKVFVR